MAVERDGLPRAAVTVLSSNRGSGRPHGFFLPLLGAAGAGQNARSSAAPPKTQDPRPKQERILEEAGVSQPRGRPWLIDTTRAYCTGLAEGRCTLAVRAPLGVRLVSLLSNHADDSSSATLGRGTHPNRPGTLVILRREIAEAMTCHHNPVGVCPIAINGHVCCMPA